MDFREAIDDLCEKVGHEDVATALGVSVQTIRQARMAADAKAYRTPPSDWRSALIQIAEEKAQRYLRLASSLKCDVQGDVGQQAPSKTERASPPARFEGAERH